MRSLPLVLCLWMLTSPLSTQEPAEPALRGRLRAIRIDNKDIFAPATRDRFPLAAVVDALHVTTLYEVIARELWFAPGDIVDATQAAEFERNLRALGLFAEVEVRLRPTDVAGDVDLEIRTRDRLTLSFGGGASYVGGVTGVRATIGESNLLGYGNRLVATFTDNSEGDYRGSLAYSDLHVLDSWHTGSVRLSRTDDGDSLGLELRRPFKHLADPRAYGIAASHDELATEFFRGGEAVAEVPERRDTFGTDLLWAAGDREQRRRLGFLLTHERRDYDAARGVLAPALRVPGDTTSVFFGPTASARWISGFRKVNGVDTLDFVQDIVLGTSLGATLGGRWRDEDGRAAQLQPEVAVDAGWAAEPLPQVLINLTTGAGARWHDASAVGWNCRAAGRAFWLQHPRNTLGALVAFDAVEELQDLRQELTLGEDNGLRGYRARQFAGTRRLHATLEDRFDTGIELATLRLGLVAFVDTGWVGNDSDLGRPYTSTGVGLRLGSRQLFGDGVFRIDLAKPLDRLPGEDDGWQLSLTAGQVFTFGGNTTVAGTR